MIIGIVGAGVVGRATARVWMEHGEVRVWDKDRYRTTHPLEAVLEADVIFVSLPTPQQPGGLAADVSALDDFFGQVAGSERVFVLRSTVPVGTTRSLSANYRLPNLVHSPEFLTARVAATDAMLPARNIVGGPERWGKIKLARLYQRRFPGVPLLLMTSDESELVKLACNSFFAVKISFFNEVFSFCEKRGLDWDAVLDGVLSDGRISHSHTRVPGPDGRFGFGGACLQKDPASFVAQLEGGGLSAAVTRAALERNVEDRKRRRT